MKVPKSFWGPKAGPRPHAEKGSLHSHDAAAHHCQLRPVMIWGSPLIKSWICPCNSAVRWLDGTKKANTPYSSPLGVMLKYSNPLLMVRLLHTQKSTQPSSVSACLSRYFFSWVSCCSAGVSF